MRGVVLFVLALLFPAALGGGAWAQEPMLLPVEPEPLVIETKGGEARFSIEVADEPGERSRGLMFRREMNDDHGMLFVFSQSSPRAFWMQNTPMPLDLLFVGEDGRVRAIEAGEPFSTDSIAPGVNARFVLELKAGTTQESGIDIGDRLRHPLIDSAVAD